MMITVIEVREVRDATLFAKANISSSWVITAFSWLGGATREEGPDKGVPASGSAG